MALLPFFVAFVAYGNTKYVGEDGLGFNAESRCAWREAIGLPERSEHKGPQGPRVAEMRREEVRFL